MKIKTLLEAYRANSPCECYPWADTWPYSGGIADIGQNRGRFPTQLLLSNNVTTVSEQLGAERHSASAGVVCGKRVEQPVLVQRVEAELRSKRGLLHVQRQFHADR